MDRVNPLTALIGRMLMSIIFILSAAGKIFNWDGTAQMMAHAGMPLVPVFLLGAIAFELFGGLSLFFGFKTRIGALALIIFLIPTTLIFHNFLFAVGAEQQSQMIQLLKNTAILGGLFFILGSGPGALSLDAILR